jgi:DNA polymerase-4
MLALTPLVEPLSLDEAFLDLTGTERLLGGPPALAMARLAARIEAEVGITVSVGLSHNKYLAKVASDLDKPRGFSVIGRAGTLDFLSPRPVRSIWGVGAALAGRLESDGLHAIADLRPFTAAELVTRYGSIGQRLHDLARGIDPRRVDPDQPTKSISAETTFETDISDRDQLIGHLWRLAVKTSDRAKAKGLAGRTVTLKLKCANFRGLTRQERLPAPTSLTDTIYHHGEAMLLRLLDRAPFRLIGIGISDLSEATEDAPPPDLFDNNQTATRLTEAATDKIRARFGKDAIIRGRALR